MHHQLITRDIKTGKENPVSIPGAWPELLKKNFRGKLRGSRSKLYGNRENECRVKVIPAKRVTNKVTKMREEIAANRTKRNRLAFITHNPDLCVGGISSKGTIQPREHKGKFLKAVQVKY